jgi:HEAT repeat protein
MCLSSIERRSCARPLRTLGLALLLFATAGLGACATTQDSAAVDLGEPRWLEPSPALRQKIEEQAQRMPWTHGSERVELIRWFAAVGEPAYPTLIAMALDPRKDVAGSALAALGATRDSRLVDELHKLSWPAVYQDPDLELERARTLLRLGDWDSIPVLLRGLKSDDLMTRALCNQALFEATHEQFEFDPKGSPEEREAAVKKWEAWWQARSRDPLLEAAH